MEKIKEKNMEKDMERKVSGYYGTGEELLVPITGWRAAVVRVEEAGKKCVALYNEAFSVARNQKDRMT